MLTRGAQRTPKSFTIYSAPTEPSNRLAPGNLRVPAILGFMALVYGDAGASVR